MNCANCIQQSKEFGAQTYCDSGRELHRCPIGDAAPYPELEEVVANYLKAKFLQSYQNDLAASEVYRASGLLEDLDLLMTLEGVWGEYKRVKNVESQMKRKHGR